MTARRSHRVTRVRRDRGQALVEFSLVAPVILLLIFAVADFARAWNTYQVITDAAREGARTAVIDNPGIALADVQTVIGDALDRASLDSNAATVSVTGFRSGRGNPTTIRIEYQYSLGWVGALVTLAQGNRDLTLVTEIVMRNE